LVLSHVAERGKRGGWWRRLRRKEGGKPIVYRPERLFKGNGLGHAPKKKEAFFGPQTLIRKGKGGSRRISRKKNERGIRKTSFLRRKRGGGMPARRGTGERNVAFSFIEGRQEALHLPETFWRHPRRDSTLSMDKRKSRGQVYRCPGTKGKGYLTLVRGVNASKGKEEKKTLSERSLPVIRRKERMRLPMGRRVKLGKKGNSGGAPFRKGGRGRDAADLV